MTDMRPGAGARDQHRRRTAARLRRLHAAGATPEELRAALETETPSERAWRLGAEGEERLGERLNDWARASGLGVLHDLEILGRGGANIDHIVIGPAGVTVIDAKAWTGQVAIRASGVWTGRYGHGKDLQGVADQVAVVRRLLGDSSTVPVRGVLCLVNENQGCPTRELLKVGTVLVGRPALVAAFAAAGGPLDPATCRSSFDALQAGLTVRGGAVPPAQALASARGPEVRDAPVSTRRRQTTNHRQSPRATAPARRSVRRRGAVRTGLLQLGALALVAAFVADAIQQEPSSATTKRASPLTQGELRGWAPEIGRRARAVTAVALEDVSLKTTSSRFHIRFRGGSCRLRVSVNRWTARSAQDAVIVPGRAC